MSTLDDLPPRPPARWVPLVDELRQDYVHGASWLARRAADMLAACASEALAQASAKHEQAPANPESGALGDLAELAWALAWARPSMAAIANTITTIWHRALLRATEPTDSSEAATIERLCMEAERQRDGWAVVVTELAQRISPLLRSPVFTLSRSGSVEHALIAAAREHAPDAPLEVIIAESHPGGEGVALASALAAKGALVTVMPDSAVGMGMTRAGMLLLGVDSVRGDGALVNKVGSYPAALVAADVTIPVYALCERLKITPTSYPLILERQASEDTASQASAGWARESWLFDVTPSRLITAYVTEVGELSLDEISQVARQREAALEALRSSVERRRQSGLGRLPG